MFVKCNQNLGGNTLHPTIDPNENLLIDRVLIESRLRGRPGKGLHNSACLKVIHNLNVGKLSFSVKGNMVLDTV